MRKNFLWFLFIIFIWETGYRIIGWKSWVFPAPSHILDSTLSLLNIDSNFGYDVVEHWPFPDLPNKNPKGFWQSPLVTAQVISCLRLLIGFFFSALFGSLIGVIMWRFNSVNQFFGPIFLGLQTLPSVCWVPLAILLFGINEVGILFVLIVGSICSIAIALRDGLKNLSPIYRKAGKMLGAHRLNLYRYVLLPASLPALSNSLRQGFAFCWRSLMGAELIFSVENQGLGFLLAAGRDFSDVAQVVAIMILMVMIGMIIDAYVFAKIDHRIRQRFGLV